MHCSRQLLQSRDIEVRQQTHTHALYLLACWDIETCNVTSKRNCCLQVPWEKERAVVDGTPVNPAQDLRYYSRGLFNHPIITQLDGVRGKASFFLLNGVRGKASSFQPNL